MSTIWLAERPWADIQRDIDLRRLVERADWRSSDPPMTSCFCTGACRRHGSCSGAPVEQRWPARWSLRDVVFKPMAFTRPTGRHDRRGLPIFRVPAGRAA